MLLSASWPEVVMSWRNWCFGTSRLGLWICPLHCQRIGTAAQGSEQSLLGPFRETFNSLPLWLSFDIRAILCCPITLFLMVLSVYNNTSKFVHTLQFSLAKELATLPLLYAPAGALGHTQDQAGNHQVWIMIRKGELWALTLYKLWQWRPAWSLYRN